MKLIDRIKQKKIPKNRIIDKPGYYRFTQDIIVKDEPIGIHIKTNSVTLDFQGHRLIANHTRHFEHFGIHVANVEKIRVFNGKIEGFYYGLMASEITDLIIHNIHFEDIKYIAINTTGQRAIIHDNLIQNLDFHYQKNNTDSYVIGIRLGSSNAQIIKNVIKNMNVPEEGINPHVEYVGILVGSSVKGSLIFQNHLINNLTNRTKTYGIWSAEDSQIRVVNNCFTNHVFDIASTQGDIDVINNRAQNSKEFTNIALDECVSTLNWIEKNIDELL